MLGMVQCDRAKRAEQIYLWEPRNKSLRSACFHWASRQKYYSVCGAGDCHEDLVFAT